LNRQKVAGRRHQSSTGSSAMCGIGPCVDQPGHCCQSPAAFQTSIGLFRVFGAYQKLNNPEGCHRRSTAWGTTTW
jgi:hypothetical protein